MASSSKSNEPDMSSEKLPPRMVNRIGVLMIDSFSHDLPIDVNNDTIETIADETFFGLSEHLRERFELGPETLELTGVRIYKGVSSLLLSYLFPDSHCCFQSFIHD